MRWKLFGAVVLVLVGVVAVVVVVVRPGAASTGDAQYLTAPVTRETVTSDVAADGAVEPVTRYGLAFGQVPSVLGSLASNGSSSSSASSASGSGGGMTWTVATVNVAPGSSVRKGAVLATASTTAIDAQISQAANTLAAAQNQLAQATSTLDAAVTDEQIWQARSAYYNARNAVAGASQAKSDLESQKARATIIAPADGMIEEVNLGAGLDAPSGDALVLDAGGLQAIIGVTETDLPNVKVGQQATVAINAISATTTGTVTAIAPVAASGNTSVVTYDVTVGLAAPPAEAKPGMSVSVSITVAQASDVIAVPSIALLGQAGSYSVRVMDGQGAISSVAVQVGLVTSDLAEIRSGLSAGQRVVVGVSTARSGSTTTTGGFGGLGGGGLRGVTGGGGAFGR